MKRMIAIELGTKKLEIHETDNGWYQVSGLGFKGVVFRDYHTARDWFSEMIRKLKD
jgi:hypothetical protein